MRRRRDDSWQHGMRTNRLQRTGLFIITGQLGLGLGSVLIVSGTLIGWMAVDGMADVPGEPATWHDGVQIGGPPVFLGLILFVVGRYLYHAGRRAQRNKHDPK